ncbi:hypothetical protein CXU09_10145 [Akkermansia muciniphila]|uniref:Uncharacterized protein n=1 Tax=Akkermansia muciniphila TaxID=239935 RepID=A0AAP8T8L9_9BACT|nr:hypothetical protein CXU09_10145 [Akkermansia muciniphila]
MEGDRIGDNRYFFPFSNDGFFREQGFPALLPVTDFSRKHFLRVPAFRCPGALTRYGWDAVP